MENLSDLATFSVDLCMLYADFFAIFLLPVCLTYWPRKYTTRVDHSVDNSHHVWNLHEQSLPSYSVFVCWYVTWPCDFDLWPFDVEQVTYMAGHVTNIDTKFEDPTPIRSWVTSYNVSRWLPLKLRTRPLRSHLRPFQQHLYCACAETVIYELPV